MSQQTVKTLAEAKEWFSRNSGGIALCVKPDGSQQTCATFPEAEQFFGPEPTTEAEPVAAAASEGGTSTDSAND